MARHPQQWVRQRVTVLLLVSFLISPLSAYGQSAPQAKKSEKMPPSSGYDFVVQETKKLMGDDYTPDVITQGAVEKNITSPQSTSLPLDGEMSSMSVGTEAVIQDHLYQIANHVQDSRVSGVSGAFSHSIPIVIPPGRNGMEPSLELRYSNQSNEELNIAGYGWDVPIPYIERNNERGSDVLYTRDDFVSSISGELATTTDPDVYVARSDDGSYLRYEFASSTNQWTVSEKNGKIYKFGHASTTRQDKPGDSSKVYRWMLEEVRDANGNYVAYEYFKDSGYIYPSQITYTGNDVSEGIFTVDFNLELRTDNATSTKAGFEAESRYRIAEIVSSIDGEWVRKYELDYTTGDNDRRSLLDSVLESGRSLEGTPTTLSLPATNFDYQTSNPGWATTTDFSLPEKFITGTYTDAGTRIADVNGDALPDLIQATQGTTTKTYINDGDGWNLDANSNFPLYFVDSTGVDLGTRLLDLNGDGLVDVLQDTGATSTTYTNTGSGWATTTDWDSPRAFVGDGGRDVGTRIADVNDDGLSDILFAQYYPESGFGNEAVYLNTGTAFSSSGWTIPISFQNYWASSNFLQPLGTFIDDVNNDGLPDLVTGDSNQEGTIDNGVFLNTGSGWAHESSWVTPHNIGSNGIDQAQRLVDVNGDNLPDWIGYGVVYLNNGHNWVQDNAWSAPIDIGGEDGYSAHLSDIDGDGMVDIIQRNDTTHTRFLSQGSRVDSLTHIDESGGGNIDVVYKMSAEYADGSGNRLSPNLPFQIQTAAAIAVEDGMGTVATTSYQYENGELYYAGAFDRTVAGFGTVQKTDPEGNVIRIYHHQGNSSASTTGEYSDHRSKIGRVYRSETYDNDENLYSTEITRWEHVNRSGEADFVYATTTLNLLYDGDGDHRDTAETYSYSTTTGSLLERISWGEVSGSNDGSFSDTGSDKRKTTYTYTASSTGYLIAPSQEMLVNQNDSKVSESKYYYDQLTHGSIGAGNVTKQENWKEGSAYIDLEKTYNSYGLVTEEKDPLDNTTLYSYDSYNLYPATTTNALSQTVVRIYDYSSGKPLQTKDLNGLLFETSYDPLDRIKETKQPDQTTPSTLVTRSQYVYTDTGMPRKIQQTDHLSSTISVDTFTYLNGVGKKIQERRETEDGYSVRDYGYNKRGLLQKESLPYTSSGSSYTGTSSPVAAALITTLIYDPLGRIQETANVTGTSTVTYDQWVTTSLDVLGNEKDIEKDAYGNIVEVVEHEGASDFITAYQYSSANKLTKITDADGNIRNFTYDGLGRRLTAQDLHDPADGTYGTWTYAYDAAGNLASSTDPKSQTVEFTYDDLNRVLSENFTGSGGTEISYAYDTCTYGIGRLCTATSTGAVSIFLYDPLGYVANESRTIDGTSYETAYSYDRGGSTLSVIYPDDSEVAYAYGAAGQLESISQKESGGSFSYIVEDFDYAPTGNISYKEFGNGVTTEYTFAPNELYRLVRIYTVASSSEESFGGGELGFYELPVFAVQRSAELPLAFLAFAPEVIEPLLQEIQPEPTDVLPVVLPTEEETPIVEEITPEPVEITLPEITSTTTEEVLIEPIDPFETSTTTIETELSTTTPVVDELPLIPLAEHLKLKAPFPKHLGTLTFPDGVIKYAYKSDSRIDTESISDDVISAATKQGIAVQREVVEKRTAHSRTFATDTEGIYITEIIGGEPQYYEDENGEWWQAEYATTTKEAYDTQVKEVLPIEPVEEPGVLEVISALLKKTVKKVASALGLIAKRAYAATTTFYPDGNTESVSVDGDVAKTNSTSWSTTRNSGDGNVASDQYTSVGVHAVLGTSNGTNRYGIGRTIFLFDTSALPDSDNVLSATLNLYMHEIYTVGSEKRVHIVSSNPASNTAVVVEDYDQLGDTSFGESDGSYTLNTYESISLNSTGLAQISKTGVTKFGIRTHHDYANSPASNSTEVAFTFKAAEETGTSEDPKLIVVHGLPPTAPTELQVGGQVDPAEISDITPDFSAIYNDPNATEIATDYQIQVSTSSDFSSVYWNSGKIVLASSTPVGSRIASIAYGGLDLIQGLTHYWRIKFWDDTDSEGAWSSETATFSLLDQEPSGLLTEGETNPSFISDNTPEFSAIYQDIDSGNVATHYQIQVSTSSAFGTVYWDSTQTSLASSTPAGSRIADISYAGSALASSTTHYWRIKFWDGSGIAGPWSDTASFFFNLSGETEIIQDINLTYDDVGNITRIDDHSGTAAARVILYSYDDLYRLTSASTTAASSTPYTETYTYTDIGNLSNKSRLGAYTYGETGYANPHAPTGIASSSLAYDENGNLTSYDSDLYTWSYRNYLSSQGDGTATTTYGYDHTGQRVLKTGTSTTAYPNQFYNTDSGATKHIFAGGELIATIVGTGTTATQYLHPDHLGSTNAVTGSASELVSLEDYYPYGEVRISGGSFDEQRKYIGQEYDEESSLSYLNARYYDGQRGQFLSQDPVFLAIGVDSRTDSFLRNPQVQNSYSYAMNNPITYKDPTGEEPNKTQAATLDQLIETMRAVENRNQGAGYKNVVSAMATHFSSSNEIPRFVYTESAGWLDMRHFTAATESMYKRGETLTRLSGIGVEIVQSLGADKGSAFSYEDLPSNSEGMGFAQFLKIQIKNDPKTSISNALSAYLKTLNPRSPKDAPNYNLLMETAYDKPTGTSNSASKNKTPKK